MNTEKSEMGVMSKFFGADRAQPIDVAPPQAPKNLALKALQERIQRMNRSARDERRSSVEAHAILRANGKREKKHRKTVDAVAASLILEGYLGTL